MQQNEKVPKLVDSTTKLVSIIGMPASFHYNVTCEKTSIS